MPVPRHEVTYTISALTSSIPSGSMLTPVVMLLVSQSVPHALPPLAHPCSSCLSTGRLLCHQREREGAHRSGKDGQQPLLCVQEESGGGTRSVSHMCTYMHGCDSVALLPSSGHPQSLCVCYPPAYPTLALKHIYTCACHTHPTAKQVLLCGRDPLGARELDA